MAFFGSPCSLRLNKGRDVFVVLCKKKRLPKKSRCPLLCLRGARNLLQVAVLVRRAIKGRDAKKEREKEKKMKMQTW